MTGAMRPMRGGRPNKVTKPGSAATAHRPSRQSLAAAAAAIDPDLTAGDENALVDVTDDMELKHDDGTDFTTEGADLGGEDDVMGEAGAGADLVDDADASAAAAAAVHAAAAAQNLDLSAENILANGGDNIMGDDHGEGPDSAYPEPTSQPGHGMDFTEAAHHQQNEAPQPDHTHQHHQQDNMLAKATEEVARDCGYGSIIVESALAKRLARERGLRPAQQRRPEQQLNLARRSNVEALFAHIAGEEVPAPCKNCHKGHGPWTTCVVVDGQMCGSCANCWYNASGARCSFHETRNPQPQPIMHPHAHLAALPPADANPYVIPPAQAIASQVANAGAVGQVGSSFNFAAALATNDPMVRFTVERAMAEVRGADRKSRQLMLVEIAAKQLALHMIEYEEMGGNGQDASQHQQHQHQQPAPDMGDEGAA